MQALRPLLLALVLTTRCSTSVGEKCMLPELSFSYETVIQLNVRERDSNKGMTYVFTESVDESLKRAKIHSRTEIKKEGRESRFEEDMIIWNPSLDGIKQFLRYRRIGDEVTCEADDLGDNELFLFLLGFNKDSGELPGVTNTLHFGPGHAYSCKEVILHEVPVTSFFTKWTEGDIDMNITYYWTHSKKWHGSAGYMRSIPLKAHIELNLKTRKGKKIPLIAEAIFSDFRERPFSDEEFYPFQFPITPCKNRKQTLEAHRFPPSFFFNSELITQFENKKFFLNVIGPRKEYYNFNDKVARSDYKPLKLKDFLNGKPPTIRGVLTDIKDFNSGIGYTINQDTGECRKRSLLDDSSEEVVLGPDGSVRMAHPSDLWHTKGKYVYNGKVRERGTEADVFLSTKGNLTTVLYLLSAKWDDFDNVKDTFQMPLKMETFKKTGTKHEKIVNMNVEGFRIAHLDFSLFDVSPCFGEDEKARRQIRFHWTPEMDVSDAGRSLSAQIRKSIADAAATVPIRVQRIEIDVAPIDKLVYVSFALLGFPTVEHLEDNLPDIVTVPLDEALDNLRDQVSKGGIRLFVPKKGGNSSDKMIMTIDSNYFQENGAAPDAPGYSPASMAALAFGTLSIGIAVGCAVHYARLKTAERGETGLSALMSIVNPNYGRG